MLDARLFTGLSLPPEVLANCEILLDELEPLARIRWSAVSQLHITTKFIGAWPFLRLPELCRYLEGAPRSPKFSVSLKGLRYFPMPNRSWVLYAQVEPCEALNQLAAATEEHLAFFDIAREPKEYLPHVTIARIPGNSPWPELDHRVEMYAMREFGSFEVNEYHLYESTPSGYRQCISIPLE